MATSKCTSPNTMDNNTLYRVLRRNEWSDEWNDEELDEKHYEKIAEKLAEELIKKSGMKLDEDLDKFHGEWTEQVIKAKDPESTESVEEHVAYGGRWGFESKFISTAKTLEAAKLFASHTELKPVRIVEINIGLLLSSGENVQVIDLTEDDVLNEHISSDNKRARNFARKFKEVLIVGTIPYKYLGRVLEIQDKSGAMRWLKRRR